MYLARQKADQRAVPVGLVSEGPESAMISLAPLVLEVPGSVMVSLVPPVSEVPGPVTVALAGGFERVAGRDQKAEEVTAAGAE